MCYNNNNNNNNTKYPTGSIASWEVHGIFSCPHVPSKEIIIQATTKTDHPTTRILLSHLSQNWVTACVELELV